MSFRPPCGHGEESKSPEPVGGPRNGLNSIMIESLQARSMKISFCLCAFLFFGNGAGLAGPDGKPLPGSTGGMQLAIGGTTLPDTQHLLFETFANLVEAQQRKSPGRASGSVQGATPPITWELADANSYLYRTQGFTVRVKRYPPGIRAIEREKTDEANQKELLLGSNEIFAADLTSCSQVIWVQFMERRFKFQRGNSSMPITRILKPEIDEMAPYRIQYQPAPGAAVMTDDAGANIMIAASASSSRKDLAKSGVQAYAQIAGVPMAGLNAVAAKYKFWTYLICLKPRYTVVGHFEWGYSADIDIVRSSYNVTPLSSRWMPGN